MSQFSLTPLQLAALRAVKDGRTPADEALLSRLRRWGLVSTSFFPPHRYFVTADGDSVLLKAYAP